MSFLAACLKLLAVGADVMTVHSYVDAEIRKDKGSVNELFEKSIRATFYRMKLDLADDSELRNVDDVYLDDSEFTSFITQMEAVELDDVAEQDELVERLVPAFRSSVAIGGHKLSTEDFDTRIRRLLKNSVDDFLSRLPLNADALQSFELTHIIDAKQDSNLIKEKLKEILQAIQTNQAEFERQSPFLNATRIQRESSNRERKNPFRIVKAEDFDHDYERLAQLFRAPDDYDEVRSPHNLIIAGGRGCGKSMILRSMSVETALRWQTIKDDLDPRDKVLTFKQSKLDYFGVYIKLARGYFYEWSSDCKLSVDAANQLFQNVFNLLLARSFIETVKRTRESKLLDVDSDSEQKFVNGVLGLLGIESDTTKTFDDLLTELRKQENHVQQYVGDLRLGEKTEFNGRHTNIHNFIPSCCDLAKSCFEELRDARVFFLLDEYENLATFQQTIVNTLAKLRPMSLTLKIATRSLGIKSIVDLQGEPIQKPRDYHIVELDYDVNKKAYSALLLDIATKRLESEGYDESNLVNLLPKAPDYHPACRAAVLERLAEIVPAYADLEPKQQTEKLHQFGKSLVYRMSTSRHPTTYSGFDDFVMLSSGIVSNFLELCKIAFYIAQADGIRVERGEEIPYSLQNKAVYKTSQAAFEWISRNIEITGPAISQLMLDLADVFREKLIHHGSEPEAGRLVIKDVAKLDSDDNKRLKEILDDSVRWSVLHAVDQAAAYFPKHKTDVRSDDFYPNRLFAPILRISPRPRWRTTFTVTELAKLADPENRGKGRTELIRKNKKQPDKKPRQRQKTLDLKK